MDTSDTPMPPMPNYDDLAKMVEDPLSPTGYAWAVARRTRPGARRQYLAARAKAVEAARRRTIDKTNN